MKAIISYVKRGFDFFMKWPGEFILFGFFLGVGVAMEMENWLRYLLRKTMILRRNLGVILLGLFLGVAMAAVTTTWVRYLVAFVFFIIALALYKSYKREQYEERLSEKIIMEKEQDGYL